MHVSVTLTVLSLTFYVVMMSLFVRAMSMRRERTRRDYRSAPRVSILKPLAGCDDDLRENLESFARIDYPRFEILLGLADPDDPARVVAERFASDHAGLDVRVVLTDPDAATNPKVAQLVGLERAATGDVYVISDSNVRVKPGYLWSLVNELVDPRAGMVTSLFVGTGERTLGAALENLQLCGATAPSLAATNSVVGRPLTVGKSMAVRRRDLADLGGFGAVGGVLAEDYVLGRRFLDAGFAVRTSLEPVENRNVDCTVARTIERHTRWAKMRRSLFPSVFSVEPVLTPVIVSSLGFVAAPSKATAAAFAFACALQTTGALMAVRVLRGRALAWRYAPLEILRSYVAFSCWLRACVSRRIVWRGHPFTLLRGSVIVPERIATRERAARRTRVAA